MSLSSAGQDSAYLFRRARGCEEHVVDIDEQGQHREVEVDVVEGGEQEQPQLSGGERGASSNAAAGDHDSREHALDGDASPETVRCKAQPQGPHGEDPLFGRGEQANV